MGAVHVIVHSGQRGLGEAAQYYKQFPWEPSPAGDLNLKSANIVKIEKATFELVLAEMTKSPAGGTVLIVCHAHDEGKGLLMPLAAGAGVSAQQSAMDRLLEAGAVTRRAAAIRAMPAKTDQEKKAKSDQWIGLATDFSLGFPTGGTTGLMRMLGHIEKVQALKLERVEFRACKIGADTDTLQTLKKLFGCQKLLAPTARTFYIRGLPIETLDRFDRLYIREHPVGKGRPPGPAGASFKNPEDFLIDVIRKNPATRIFWDVAFGYIPSANPHPAPNKFDGGTTTITLKGRVLAMLVEEVSHSWYRGSAATWHEKAPNKPQWDDATKFVEQYMMEQSQYKSGALMVSGFWTPGGDVPWILPREPDYVDQIKQV